MSLTHPTLRPLDSDPRLEPFTGYDIAYKYFQDTPIFTTVLLPKDLKPGKHPVLVRWHGGFLITGSRMFPRFLHQ
jgi:cephalosporin-C deacetylase-like acetyl esterase